MALTPTANELQPRIQCVNKGEVHPRRVASLLDQIALPVTGSDALVDFQGAQMDADHVGNYAPAIFAPGAAGDSCEPDADRPTNSVRNSPRGMA